MTDCKHCWHPTGESTSYGFGGSDQADCCWCGERTWRKWSTKKMPAPGHGPHTARNVKVYDDEEPTP